MLAPYVSLHFKVYTHDCCHNFNVNLQTQYNYIDTQHRLTTQELTELKTVA